MVPGSLLFWDVTRYVIFRRKCPTVLVVVTVTGHQGQRSEVLGNGGYCRIRELPGTPDSGQGLLGSMRLTAVGKVCDTSVKKVKRRERKRDQSTVSNYCAVLIRTKFTLRVFKASEGKCITEAKPYSLLFMTQRNAFEVATWPCSEEYVKNPSIIRPAFELLVGSEGREGLSE